MATLTPSFGDFLPAWVAEQRWYRGKGSAPALRPLGRIRWQDPAGEVGMETHLVVDESGEEPVVYQIPLTYRAEPVDFLAEALVAQAEHDELGTRYIYDGTHDPVFVQTLLQHVYAERDVPSAGARRLVAGPVAPALRESKVLSGEQSNTSVIVTPHGDTMPVMVKIFRVLAGGENPDVTIQSAIGTSGNRRVPGPIGYVEGRWPDPSGEEVRGHLAFVQELIPDSEDAWREALVAAREGTDFTEQARTLGAATASVHGALREAFGTQDASAEERAELVDQMRRRAEAAFGEVPDLEAHRAEVEAVLDRLASSDEPLPLQRIHGDYHLGQVLHSPSRGWVLLDFEGEPLRPLEERTRPDVAVRDIAGMLRSFDYAAASIRQEGGEDRQDWAGAAREAFLSGYAEESDGSTVDPTLLDTLELDKALYEVVYEARNRPTWVPIPVSAIERLVGRASGADGGSGTGTTPGTSLSEVTHEPVIPTAAETYGVAVDEDADDAEGPAVGAAPGAAATSAVGSQAAAPFFDGDGSTAGDEPTADHFGPAAGDGLDEDDVRWSELSSLDPAVPGPSSGDPEDGLANGSWGGVSDGTLLTDPHPVARGGRHRAPEDPGASVGATAAGTESTIASPGATAATPGDRPDGLTRLLPITTDAAAPGQHQAGDTTMSHVSDHEGGAEVDSSPAESPLAESHTSTPGSAAPADHPTTAAEGGWDPALDEDVELAAPAAGRASGSVLASGGVPHAPIPAPATMTGAITLAPLPRRPRTRRAGELESAGQAYLSASGWSGGYQGDPETLRARAWEDAMSGPAVTGHVAEHDTVELDPATPGQLRGRDGRDDAAGGPGTRVSAPVERQVLAAPTGPVAEHTRPLDLEAATDVVYGTHDDPHAVLGAHAHEGHVTVRSLQPDAEQVHLLLAGGRRVAMNHETGGIWVAVLPADEVPAYRLEVVEQGSAFLVDDAYRHASSLGETDLHLLAEGRHEELWKVLGAHVMTVSDELGSVSGTRFTVWAPNARAVHVMGDFNGWDGTRHALRLHRGVGVWEIFVPGIGAGTHYKFDITGPDRVRRAKADPMARASEVPPFNNSVVTQSRHRWTEGDDAWMRRRAAGDVHHGPMSVYEVHLGSWRRGLGYEELADELVAYVADMGFTHVEFMPVAQHPYGGSWGYHVTGYYAADSRFGHEDGLRYLIDRMHQAGVGVILDWVPGHFATDPWALARFDGTPLYEHADPRKGWHPEWGSYIFDFGRPEVRNFLVANATYWLEEFHADGLRVDGVASMLYLDYSRNEGQWVPNIHGGRENLEAVALLQEANATAYRRNPGAVMIAEESTSWPGVTAPVDEGGLGFGFKWNMGWMHDTLDYLHAQPQVRPYRHHALTFSIVYAFSEKYVLPISHDEVVHGKGSLVRKMAGDGWQKLATTRAFLAYQWSHPGKQLLFMGSEFAQVKEWADGGTLSWELLDQPAHAGIQRLVRDLNRLYVEHPALWQIDHHKDGFAWLDADDTDRSLYSYLRWGNEGPDGLRPVVAVLVNYGDVPHHGVRVGLPYGGRWREVLNTDAETYGGSGQGNYGSVVAEEGWHQGQPWSATVTVPPLGSVWLVPDPEPEPDAAGVAEADALLAPDGVVAGTQGEVLTAADVAGPEGVDEPGQADEETVPGPVAEDDGLIGTVEADVVSVEGGQVSEVAGWRSSENATDEVAPSATDDVVSPGALPPVPAGSPESVAYSEEIEERYADPGPLDELLDRGERAQPDQPLIDDER